MYIAWIDNQHANKQVITLSWALKATIDKNGGLICKENISKLFEQK